MSWFQALPSQPVKAQHWVSLAVQLFSHTNRLLGLLEKTTQWSRSCDCKFGVSSLHWGLYLPISFPCHLSSQQLFQSFYFSRPCPCPPCSSREFIPPRSLLSSTPLTPTPTRCLHLGVHKHLKPSMPPRPALFCIPLWMESWFTQLPMPRVTYDFSLLLSII